MNNKKILLSLFEQMLNMEDDDRNDAPDHDENNNFLGMSFDEEEAKQNAEIWAKSLNDKQTF